MNIDIWTDGSCDNNPKHNNYAYGGWGFCAIASGKVIFEDLGFENNTTSTKMEMVAVIKGLDWAIKRHPNSRVTIFSDSAYIVNCFLERWYLRWIECDWYDIKNRSYWEQMLSLYHSKLIKVKFQKVKGHAGIEYNERADYLAGEARKFLIEKNNP